MAFPARRQNFQTVSWFSDLSKRKLLNLDPPYQRRSVWNQGYKDEFIDTILLQYPAPAIFLYEEVSEGGTSLYQVVDGKQRLTAVFEFAAGAFPVSENSPVTHLAGKSFDQLSKDEKTAFWTYQFPIEYLPTNEETIINGIFQRINKNTAKLTRQELRHARFGGLFITAAEELTEQLFRVLPEGFPRLEIQSKKQMKDVELVANLLLSMEMGIRGFSQDELDAAFSEREESWNEAANIKSRFMAVNACVSELATKPANNPISKTRFRNQADFYSLCMALDLLLKGGNSCSASQMSQRLADFAGSVEDEDIRFSQAAYVDYFVSARSNSNDTGPRKKRTEILIHALQQTLNDYTSSD
jgi:Protein of unknown function DUF262